MAYNQHSVKDGYCKALDDSAYYAPGISILYGHLILLN